MLDVCRSAACSEFPNDNRALHAGAIWLCTELCATATCELPERNELAACDEDRAVLEALDQLSFAPPAVEDVAALVEMARCADTSGETDDPFATLVRVLEEVARTSGASDEAVVGLRTLLGMGRLEVTALPESSIDALVAGRQLERMPHGFTRTDAFTASVLGWQGILRAESEDFGACGAAALDEWAADLVARVLGSPVLAAGLRRELRRRGVAAFGLVAEAA